MSANFLIINDIEQFRDYTVIPLDSNKTQTLRGFYEEMADALEFPEYFGFNLDSLDELLNDLSWLEDERIAIYVADSESFISKERNPEKLASLLDVLDATCEDWRWVEEGEEHKELIFLFNDSARIRQIFDNAEIEYEAQ
jgi:RNAse (barnase) inhibitor barstar